jgi:hypothetical protein
MMAEVNERGWSHECHGHSSGMKGGVPWESCRVIPALKDDVVALFCYESKLAIGTSRQNSLDGSEIIKK